MMICLFEWILHADHEEGVEPMERGRIRIDGGQEEQLSGKQRVLSITKESKNCRRHRCKPSCEPGRVQIAPSFLALNGTEQRSFRA